MVLIKAESLDTSVGVPTEPFQLNNEKRLIDDLFKNYQVKFGRPVNNMTEKVVVYFGIYLIQLLDLVTIKVDFISKAFAPKNKHLK